MKTRNDPAAGQAARERATLDEMATKVNELVRKSLEQVRDAREAEAKDRIFPKGIDLIYVRLELGAGAAFKVALELKLAGPPSSNASLAGG